MDKREQMFSLMESYESSNLSRESFCREAGISLSKFAYWRRQWLESQEEKNIPSFVALEMDKATEFAVDIIYPNGVRLQVPKLNIGMISQLIKLGV